MPNPQAQAVQAQYESWPYPRVPLLMQVRREDLWQLNWEWMQHNARHPITTQRPRIWITGCGTFQPYVIALANPHADIIATDISSRSLELAQRRCRFYGLKNVSFVQVDLTAPETFPEGPFDWIENYGVLMCLPDPQATLGHLQQRLAPTGLLRMMVYPHFGRRRVFQIQRMAQLLGLNLAHPAHPSLLQQILQSLPLCHPLRYAFDTYYDAQNPEGIVDAFLHASDRGFTGLELAQLTSESGLQPAFFLHRPWGQPHQMMAKLDFNDVPLNLALHYLDVWQELRSNFIVVFKQQGQSAVTPSEFHQHPLFDYKNMHGMPFYKMRLSKHALLGTTMSSRTHADAVHLSGGDVRSLLGLSQQPSKQVQELLRPLDGGFDGGTWHDQSFEHTDHFGVPRLGPVSPNPFYGQLFDAWYFHQGLVSEQGWPTLEEEVERWTPYASALENVDLPWGLTPHATYAFHREAIQNWLKDDPAGADITSWAQARLSQDEDKRDQVQSWAGQWPGIQVKDAPEIWRELWVLLFSYEQLFLNINQG